MRPDARHWTMAFALAAGLHLAPLALLHDPGPGSGGWGGGGLAISLGPVGGSAGVDVTDSVPAAGGAPGAEAVDAIRPAIEAPDAVSPAAPIPPPAAVEPVYPSEPVSPVEIPPPLSEIVEPMDAAIAEAATVRTGITAREPPIVPPPPAPRKPSPTAVATAEPPDSKPAEILRRKTRILDRPAMAGQAMLRALPSDRPGDDGRAGSGSGGGNGARGSAGVGAEAGGGPGRAADYLARVSAWLERHKEYPRRARLRRQEGTALLRFIIDRQGRIVSSELARSSGYNLLDEEAEDLIRRAAPLPPMPAHMHQARLELVVPISFSLR